MNPSKNLNNWAMIHHQHLMSTVKIIQTAIQRINFNNLKKDIFNRKKKELYWKKNLQIFCKNEFKNNNKLSN